MIMMNRTVRVALAAVSAGGILLGTAACGGSSSPSPEQTTASGATGSEQRQTPAQSPSLHAATAPASSLAPEAADAREGDAPVIYKSVAAMRKKVAAKLAIDQCNDPEDRVDAKVYVTEQACWLQDHSEEVNFDTYALKDQGTYLANGGGQAIDFSTYCGVGWTIEVETEAGLRKVLKVLDPKASPAETLCPSDATEGTPEGGGEDVGASVSKAAVEAQVTQALTRSGVTADSVECKHDLDGSPGSTVTCTIKANGTSQDVKAVVTEVKNGKAYFTVEPVE